jgi:hypothetical protein
VFGVFVRESEFWTVGEASLLDKEGERESELCVIFFVRQNEKKISALF